MITYTPEWEGEETRLVALGGLPAGPGFPQGVSVYPPYGQCAWQRQPERLIRHVVVHQSLSTPVHGVAAVEELARWHNLQARPGQPHTFVIPTQLAVADGKFEVYRCWDDAWVTEHSAPWLDAQSVSICLVGTYASRHAPADLGGSPYPEPDPAVSDAFEALLEDYLLPRYRLSWSDVLGGFDLGSPADPGDALESIIRRRRGGTYAPAPVNGEPSERPLRTFEQRRSALAELGYASATARGYAWREALEAYQRARPWLLVTGVWCRQVERAVRLDLSRVPGTG